MLSRVLIKHFQGELFGIHLAIFKLLEELNESQVILLLFLLPFFFLR
jgi:hypothetical protein